jgi:HD-GYP domain-containing protein (c-di-GMP phosphodiesterase class II)/tRNA A-37 threonylcarbamoyl transferase component Bud32
MKSMPPLRTAREQSERLPELTTPPPQRSSENPAKLSDAIPVAAKPPTLTGLEHPRLPSIAKSFLAELISVEMISEQDLPRFIQTVGDRISSLSSRERIGDALVHFGFITEYQRTRAVTGQLFGVVFGPYRVLDRIGAGTSAVVFLGEHKFLERKVAIKVFTDQSEDHSCRFDRFVTEAHSLAALNHPHIVSALDAGVIRSENQSLWYLVLEPVTGGDLEQHVYTHGPQSVGRVAMWGWQAALGLHAAHRTGLVHRDVKPSNLLLTDSGQIKVSDFGLVRRYDASQTGHRAVIGTLEFLSPEQLNDPTTAGPAADCYGLAVSLFWTLTGKLPYPEGLRPSELVEYLRNQVPHRLREFNPKLPEELDDLIARMLSRNPGDRPSLQVAATAFSAIASPTSHPDIAAQLYIPDDASDIEAARFAVQDLEERLQTQASQINDLRDAVLNSLKAAVIRRPGETAGHVQRVAAYSRVLAAKLGSHEKWSGFQSKATVSELARAATLHDLGLVGISDTIDTGAVSRTPSEEHEYRTHPDIGSNMLGELAERHGQLLPFLRMLRDVVRHHHERWDGTGWPDGLQGTNIPLAARIVSVADAYDRLRAPGPGKRGMSHNDAANAVTREVESKFDPDVISAFNESVTILGEIFATIPDDPIVDSKQLAN